MRNSDGPYRFENQIIFFFHVVRNEPVRNAARNHNVIFSAIRLFTENGLECAATFEYEDDFICPAVAIILKFVVSLFRARTIRDHVLVEQNRNAAGVEISFARNICRFQVMMPQRALSSFLQLLAFQELHVTHPRWRPQMIQDRKGFIETFGRDHVLVIYSFIFVTRSGTVTMEPDVVLSRYLANFLIIGHFDPPFYKFERLLTLPLSSCLRGEATHANRGGHLTRIFIPPLPS